MLPQSTTPKEIPLTQGKVALVDAQDYERVMQFNWAAVFDGWTWYAITTIIKPKRTSMRMHRFILSAPHGLMVDHKDRNGLNNTRDNLRFATASQNGHNAGISLRNTSGYKGVYKEDKKWIASITINRKQFIIGRYLTAEDAARAYDAKAKESFGEFARTNF